MIQFNKPKSRMPAFSGVVLNRRHVLCQEQGQRRCSLDGGEEGAVRRKSERFLLINTNILLPLEMQTNPMMLGLPDNLDALCSREPPSLMVLTAGWGGLLDSHVSFQRTAASLGPLWQEARCWDVGLISVVPAAKHPDHIFQCTGAENSQDSPRG